MGGIQDSNDEESVDEDFVAPKKGDDDDSDSDSDDGDDGSGGGGDDDGDGDDSGEEDEAPKPEKKKKKKKEHKEPKPEKKASKPKKRPAEDAPPAKKKKKAKKDPNAPKGKSSAFIFFGGAGAGREITPRAVAFERTRRPLRAVRSPSEYPRRRPRGVAAIRPAKTVGPHHPASSSSRPPAAVDDLRPLWAAVALGISTSSPPRRRRAPPGRPCDASRGAGVFL